MGPHICMEARDQDVGSDRWNVSWSPENILIDTVARLQQDLPDIRAESRQFRTPGSHMLCRPIGRLHSRQLKYPGSWVRPVGTSTIKCSRPLSVPMGGMILRQRCSYSPTWREML